MKREQIRVATTEGDREVEVIRRRGVWVFHRSPFFELTFSVTHAPSGLAAFTGTQSECRAVVEALGAEIPTWNWGASFNGMDGVSNEAPNRVIEAALREAA